MLDTGGGANVQCEYKGLNPPLQKKTAFRSDRLRRYRITSLIRKCQPLGPHSRTMPRALWKS